MKNPIKTTLLLSIVILGLSSCASTCKYGCPAHISDSYQKEMINTTKNYTKVWRNAVKDAE